MEALQSIGLTEKDVRKVSSETADSINELDGLSSYVNEEEAAQNIKDAYKSLYTQVENYLYSAEFRIAAKKVGVTISSVADADEKIVIAEIPKVKSKTLSERIAERNKAKSTPKVEAPITEKVEAPTVEEVEVVETPTVEEVDTITLGELFGASVKGEKSGEIVGREMFSMMIAYGKTDYILGYYEDSKGFHYRLDLPLSLGQLVFSFSNIGGNNNLSSIVDVWKAYVADNAATLNLVSRSENELEALSNVLGFGGVTKERIPLSSSELKNEKYDADLFETVGSVYSRSISNSIYYDVAKKIRAEWDSKEYSDDTYAHGLHFRDYVYTSAERFYKKGGYSIVAKKYTFFVPKGLNKKDTFGEIGTHLKETEIKTSKFEKNIEVGKRFQVSMGRLEDAVACRVIGSSYKENDGDILIADEAGDSYKISANAYNYFLKYYGSVSLKISDTTIVVLYSDNVVGVISAERFNAIEISGMFAIEDFKTELRSIDTDAYDFMVSQTVEVEEAVEVDIEKVEEGDIDIDEAALKKELTERIEFLSELLEDAVEDGDNQQLIDELNMELESLNDLLEDIE